MKKAYKKIMLIAMLAIVAAVLVTTIVMFATRYNKFKKGIYFQESYGYYAFNENETVNFTYKYFNVKNDPEEFSSANVYLVSSDEEIKTQVVEVKDITSTDLYDEKEIKIKIVIDDYSKITVEKLKFELNGNVREFGVGGVVFEKIAASKTEFRGNIELRYIIEMIEPTFTLTVKNVCENAIDFSGIKTEDGAFHGGKSLAPEEEIEVKMSLEHLSKDYANIVVKAMFRYNINGDVVEEVISIASVYYGIPDKNHAIMFLEEKAK